MATTPKLTTAEDLAEIDEPGRYDLIRGELTCMAPAGGDHGRVGLAIGAHVYMHVQRESLGEAYGAETGFLLGRDPDIVLAPDVAFVRAGRLPPEGERSGFLPVAPDLVVEVVSPSDRMSAVSAKVTEYLKAGVQMIWVVEPGERTVTVYHADRSAQLLLADEELDGGDVMPGFRLSIADIFR